MFESGKIYVSQAKLGVARIKQVSEQGRANQINSEKFCEKKEGTKLECNGRSKIGVKTN